jgi:hypothetical protein
MVSDTRTVTSKPLKGSIIEVEVPTTVNGVLWPQDIFAHPFGGPNRRTGEGVGRRQAYCWPDMAATLRSTALTVRAAKLAMQVPEVLGGFERSSTEGRHVMIEPPVGVPNRYQLALGEVFMS